MVGVGGAGGIARIDLFPGICERVAINIRSGRRECEWSQLGNGAVRATIHIRIVVGGGDSNRAGIAGAGVNISRHFQHIVAMENVFAVWRHVIAAANAGIRHNGRPATWFNGRGLRVKPSTVVERVIAAELVAHFVHHIINVEWIANGRVAARYATGFQRTANNADIGSDTAAAGAE